MATTPASENEIRAMRRAVTLAARGTGHTAPNPVVGCVILDRQGEFAGEGWHQRAGGPHAEAAALAAAGAAAHGGTAVVTLEPCRHTGRTGPCTEALLAAGIARVVYAAADPSATAGGGGAMLTRAGTDVVSGVLRVEAEAVNAPWLTATRHGRPHVNWKYAATLDGRSAAADGSSRWITGSAARADVHRLRAEADAVLVGAGTVRADDPHLAARDQPGARQPLRVALDTGATAVRPGARLLDGVAPTLVAVADDLPSVRTAWLAPHAEVLPLPRATSGPGLDLTALLSSLHRRGVRSVLLEGGPTLAGAFLAAGYVDQVTGYLAPALLGAGPAVLGRAGITTIAEAVRLEVTATAHLGPDTRITAVPRTPAPRALNAPTTATATEEI